MKDIQKKIKLQARVNHSEIIAIRRHIHQYPETGMQEFKTSEFIASRLKEYGIAFETGIAKTGIIAFIKGQNPDSRVIALRADMDALPMQEENDTPYKSKNKGVMHACGHDAHMAILLGAAKILNELKDEFKGTVKLVFQPSEEQFPGGAIMMIKEGVLENPKPDLMIGLHVLPTLDSGEIGLKPGKYMASTDEVYLTVKGKGGHAATPELNIDTVLVASNIVVALQQLVSRNANPAIPTVLSFGRFIADGRTNIIPDIVKIDGTLRTFDEEWRAKAHCRINEIAKSVANSMGADVDVDIHKGYPYLENDYQITESVKRFTQEYLGKEKVKDLEMRMTAEDFAYFAQQIPSCYFRLGIRNTEKGIEANLHTTKFDIDEKSLETGMGVMAWLAVRFLNSLT